MKSTAISTDFLIIGSGAAGLNAALHASRHGEVRLITKSGLEDSSSYWAQGGIAAVLTEGDTYQSHKKDTLAAGRGLCNTQAVDLLVREGAREVQRYIDRGMNFDKTDGELDLGLEGGHSNRRVLHANGAATGKALIEFLTKLVKAEERITVTEQAFVYRLLQDGEGRCRGAEAYLYREDELLTIESPVTILATGGYSGLFQRSTNPHTSTGDGLWLGYEAGAILQDLEFVQFHPTAFYAPDGSTFLISEAVRGEGAYLLNEKGERFMEAYKQKELSPRDVVSQEIFRQIEQQEKEYVYLDIRHLDTQRMNDHFPNLMGKVAEHGIDIKNEGIPVAPAAHYCIGGLATDLDARTTVEGLYACGEVAATGVHGANRLASNSLLECLVFSKRAVTHAAMRENKNQGTLPVWGSFVIQQEAGDQFVAFQQQVSALLSRHVGIQRHREGLEEAVHAFHTIKEKLPNKPNEYFSIRSRGLVQLAGLIAEAALQRKESRGVHTRIDFPERDNTSRHLSFQKPLEHKELL
ncbi:L-aspartate oxidase [Fodinibius sediminis]|uniref:L-aspartate oxidase n=1 Tax=Fodinibius sediminis TaxID=1214077 RepID=A0A521D2W7_9BACT|nr:L-aspartate oxidase [Fodinibius sediminis]SMO66029.1 L-aspartate oxidase [Fodinibius sediminis]